MNFSVYCHGKLIKCLINKSSELHLSVSLFSFTLAKLKEEFVSSLKSFIFWSLENFVFVPVGFFVVQATSLAFLLLFHLCEQCGLH